MSSIWLLSGFAPEGEWVDPACVGEPVDPFVTAAGVLSLARAFGAEPGSYGMGILASLSLRELDTAGLVEVAAMWEAQAGWVAAAQNEVFCALRDRAAATAAAAAEEADAEAGDAALDPEDGEPDRDWVREEVALGLSLSGHDARRRLDTAVALRDRLPATAAALEAGRVSWRHADALAAETAGLDARGAGVAERRVLADRRVVSVGQWRRAARKHAAALAVDTAEPDVARAGPASRYARAWHVADGMGYFEALLTTEGLMTVTTALDELAAPTEPADTRPVDMRRADALVDLCTAYLAGGINELSSMSPAAKLVVHVPADALNTRPSPDPGARGSGPGGPSGPATIGDEPIEFTALDRLVCDCLLERVITDPATGAVLDLGRTARMPDTQLRRAVHTRDWGRCTFPACGRRGNLHIHHIQAWNSGGRTDQENLTLVCSRHHHAVHEGGWQVIRERDGQLTWISPGGQKHTAPNAAWVPPPDPPWPDQPWHLTPDATDEDADTTTPEIVAPRIDIIGTHTVETDTASDAVAPGIGVSEMGGPPAAGVIGAAVPADAVLDTPCPVPTLGNGTARDP